jgi:hypothetical protein
VIPLLRGNILLRKWEQSFDISHKSKTYLKCICRYVCVCVCIYIYIFFSDKSSEFAPCEAKVHHIRFDVMLFDPIARKLINESSGTFLAGQKLVAKAGGCDIRGELLKLSRQYRYSLFKDGQFCAVLLLLILKYFHLSTQEHALYSRL